MAVLVALLGLSVACSSAQNRVPDPTAEVAAYAAAWQAEQFSTAAAMTTSPAVASQLLKQTDLNLSPSKFAVTPGPVTRTADITATATATVAWTLGTAGIWTYDVTWDWVFRDGGWRLDWSATDVHPQLGDQQNLVVRLTKSTNGSLVDRNDVQVAGPVTVYSVVAQKAAIADVPAAAAQLTSLLATFDPSLTAADITAGINAAESDAGYTVINLREPDFQRVAAALTAMTGISTPSAVRDLPPTKDFAKVVLSQIEPVVADLTTGHDGWRIAVVDTTGAELSTLAQEAPVPGKKVMLTLDTAIQQAADAAAATVAQPAVIVAIQPSTGEILAVGQNAAANGQGAIALTGRYPPGSIFKIVTATAGVDLAGLTPTSQLPCPATVTVDSRAISNSHKFDLGTVDLTLAFAKSCNTTFATIAEGLPSEALTTTAASYGIGLDFDVTGIVTLTGQSPPGDSAVGRAENGFGQGTNLVTPFAAALMAATVAHGSMPTPVLIRGTTTKVDHPPSPLSAAAAAALPVLMSAVATEGTGRVLGTHQGIRLKTGTAEFADPAGEIHAHAWTVGYLNDVAFSAFIEVGEDSAQTNTLLGKFLAALPPG